MACASGLVLGLHPVYAQPGAVDPEFVSGTGFNSTVYSIAVQPDGKAVVAGAFTNFNGSAVGNIARVNVDGSLDTTFMGVLSNLTSGANLQRTLVSVEASGGILVCGSIAQVNRVPWTNVARLSGFGALDQSFDPVNRADGTLTNVLALPDGSILVGGQFTHYDGVARYRLARIHADGSLDPSFDAGTNFSGALWPMAAQTDGKVIVPGTFTNLAGIVRQRLARLNPDGTLDESFDAGAGPSGGLDSIVVQADGNIVVAGARLQTYNGIPRRGLARLHADGSLDTEFDPGIAITASFPLNAVAQPDGKILLAGGSTLIGVTRQNGIARFNANGEGDVTFATPSGLNFTAFDGTIPPPLALQGRDRLLLGGTFQTVGGVSQNRILRLLLSDATPAPSGITLPPADQTPNAGMDLFLNVVASGYPALSYQWFFQGSPVVDATNTTLRVPRVSPNQNGAYSVVVTNSEGGATSIVAQVTVRQTAATPDGFFRPNAKPTDPARAVAAQQDGKILVAGKSVKRGIFGQHYLARLNADGTIDGGFHSPTPVGPGLTYAAAVLPLADGTIMLGGALGLKASMYDLPTARLLADGTRDPSFTGFLLTGSGSFTLCLVQSASGSILSGGRFIGSGATGYSVEEVTPGGSFKSYLGPWGNIPDEVHQVALQPDGRILVAGWLTDGGVVGYRVFRLHPDGSRDNSLQTGTGADGWINGLAVQADGTILLGGEFAHFNGAAAPYLVALNSDGTMAPGFNVGSGPNARITSLGVGADGRPVIGGEFTQVNGIPRAGLARLEPDGTVDSGFDPGWGANGAVSTLAQRADGGWVVGGAFTLFEGLPYSSVVCLNPDPDGAPAITIQPSSQTVTAGQRTWLGVAASGGPSVQFQWRRNGADIPDATNAFLFFENATSKDNGVYSVIASNAFGMGESQSAQLTASPVPKRIGAVDPAFFPELPAEVLAFGPPLLLWRSNQVLVGRQPGNTNLELVELQIDGARVGTLPIAITSSNVFRAELSLLATQPDGSMLVGVSEANELLGDSGEIVRLDSSGVQDPAFHTPIFSGGSEMRHNSYFSLFWAIGLQDDGKILVSGYFTLAGTTACTNLARLNADGSLDPTFQAGASPSRLTYALAVLDSQKVIIGGAFTNVQGITRSGLARLNSDGTLDLGFDPGAGGGTVSAIAALADGKLLVGGNFVSFGGLPAGGIVRLQEDGTVDGAFHAEPGFKGGYGWSVDAILTQTDGRILVGGSFLTYNGVSRSGIARLNTDGSLDTSFDPGLGANGADVAALTFQGEDELLIAGTFTRFDQYYRPGYARLFLNGGVIAPQLMMEAAGGGLFQLKAQTDSGANYTLQFKGSLSDTNWSSLQPTVGDGSLKVLLETSATNQQQFYRLRAE